MLSFERGPRYMGLFDTIVVIFKKFTFSLKSFFEFLKKICKPLKT